MAWTAGQFRARYRDLARYYDAGLWAYRAVGLRLGAYRQAAVDALRLSPGDTVVDLGCGTGLNFARLQRAIGPRGRIIGVDLTDAMLGVARERAQRHGWRNVGLIEADMRDFSVPEAAAGVLATLTLSTIEDYDTVVARAARRLRAGARISNLELRWPQRWPGGLAAFAAWLNRPAGVTPDIVHRLPAQSIARHFVNVEYRELYFGAAYLCAGSAPDNGGSNAP